jgi:hypothetical protein
VNDEDYKLFKKEKTMKVSKNLITSLSCLVLSVFVCAWACFAWFSLNNHVDAGNINTSVVGGGDDVVSISVTAYYLEQEGNETTIVYKRSTPLGDDDDMYEYGGTEYSCTAILLKINYQINAESTRTFAIGASTDAYTVGIYTTESGGVTSYSSKLSNVVSFTQAEVVSQTDGTFTPVGDTYSYLSKDDSGDYVKSSSISIIKNIDAEEGFEQTKYLIVDYNSDLFGNVFSMVLEQGGNISSKVKFDGDITITLGEHK